jgi:High-affinity Fe2+/Pb2+ permease
VNPPLHYYHFLLPRGTIIIGQYRTVIQNSEEFMKDEGRQKEALKAVNQSALVASVVAIAIVAIVAVTLAVVSKDLDDRVVEIIEGVSKVVAAIAILQLSTKVPKWLGLYASKKVDYENKVAGLSLKSIKFNVAWNLWREVAECGVFLIPFFLGSGAEAIPLSGVIGILVGLAGGLGVYYASKKMEDKFWLAFFLSAVTGMLSVGLFVGGCHEFEEVWGETKKVWTIEGDFWNHKRLPMAILKPFGYSSSRTVLQICCFWIWLALLLASHYYKYQKSQEMINEQKKEMSSEKAPADEEWVDDEIDV